MARTAVADGHDEAVLVDALRRGDGEAYRAVIARNNQRLFRAARGYAASNPDAEDIVQAAYVIAFEKIGSFRGDSTLSTWLLRIVINEAKQRLRKRRPEVGLRGADAAAVAATPPPATLSEPAMHAAHAQLRGLLEESIASLPPGFRSVYILREVEEMSVAETGASLGLRDGTVRSRLHRARRMLREMLEFRAHAPAREAFPFGGERCARLAALTLRRMARSPSRGITTPPAGSATVAGDAGAPLRPALAAPI